MSTILKSHKVNISKNQEPLYNFLADFNNFEKLLPADKVENWKCSGDECSFSIKGLASLGMKYAEKVPFSKISITSAGKVPFDFKLNVLLQKISENETEAEIQMDAELNMMMRMMAEKPLTNFLNILVDKYKELAESTDLIA